MSMHAPQEDNEIMSEINMTPLVDVMLVLLVIFIITLPVLHGAIKVDLPQANSQPNDVRPSHIQLELAANGRLRWDGQPLNTADLPARLQQEAARKPQPELHLLADKHTAYERLAQVMGQAQQAGLAKIGFVTSPTSP